MERKLNVKLVGIVLGSLLLAGVATHFLHAFQVRQNAYRLLERGDKAVLDKDYDRALACYGQYLTFVPDDVDTLQKYAETLDVRASSGDERIALILKMEQVLRAKPAQNALRFRLVQNLIVMDRIPEAIGHLHKLKDAWSDKAEIQHLLGWCHEAQKQYAKAAGFFEAAIRSNPKQIHSYALLAEVQQDRLNQPEEALKTMDDLVTANADSYLAYLMRARFLRRRGDEKAAENDLQSAYRLGSDKASVILEVADAARAKGKWEEATKLLKDGMTRFPDNTDFIKAIVGVELQTGKAEAAIDHLRAGLKKSPRSYELAVLMIDLLIDQKHYPEARAKINDLVNAGLNPTLPNYLRARLAVVDKEYRTAIQLLEGVRSELGQGTEWSSRVQVLLGICYREIGDHEQELQAFRRAVEEDPTWVAPSVGLGSALLTNGRVEEACQTLEPLRTAKDLPAGYWILLARARLNRQLQLPVADRRWDDVEEALTQAAVVDPKGVAVPIARAELLTAHGEFAAAEKTLDQAKAAHPDDADVWCALATLEARQNRFERAEQILDNATAKLGEKLEIRLTRCRLWGARGTPDARAKLARLDQSLPASFTLEQRARLNRELGNTWYRLDDWERADAGWRAVATDLPKDARSRFALMELALQKSEIDQAQLLRDELKSLEGDKGWLWRYGDAAILVQQARGRRSALEEARKKLAELEQVHKNWPRTALLKARIFEQEGKALPAIDEYTRALEMGEMPPASMVRLLDILVLRREFARAETELAKYAEKAPLTRDLARLGAEAALGMRDSRYAKLAVERAELAAPMPVTDYRDGMWLARIYQAAGETAKAEKALQASIEQAGHMPDVWVAWLEFLAKSNQRAKAPQEIAKLKQTLPKNRQALTLARAYEAMQDSKSAEAAYREALAETPSDVTTLTRAADFYRRADQAALAEKYYRRLLEADVGASADQLALARRKLAVLLAPRDGKQAIALLDQNRKTHGDLISDQRVRWFIKSLTPSTRQDAIARFDDSLRLQLPTSDERLLLARMFESAGTFGAARDQLAEAVDESGYAPHYLVPYIHLLIRAGDLDEARRQLARLDAIEPGSARTIGVRTALENAPKQ